MSTAAKRYAKALFDFSREKHCLDPVHEDLAALERLYEDSPEFAAFMDDTMLPADQRAAALDRLLAGRAHPSTLQFLHFLEAKGRLGLLRRIAPLFEALVHDHHGILKITILSAGPLDGDQLDRIKRRMQARFESRIEATMAVDPALIGGFRVRVGDTIHDYSIATQLAVLKHELITA